MRHVLACLAFVVWAGLAWAQASGPDYDMWQSVAMRAESSVEAARASDAAFSALRAEIVDWRSQFQEQLNTNDNRLATLRDQIAALGPAPEDGSTEAEEIANRRAELNAQLARLSAPRRTAEEAFSRANGVITEIDEILRARQAEQLLRMGPWPVNPVHWMPALRDLQVSAVAVVSGIDQAWRNPIRQASLQNNLPLVLLLCVIGVVLLTRSRHWIEMLATRIQRHDTGSSAGAAGFIVSLGQIVLPMMGLLALLRAIGATEMFGTRGQVFLDTLEPMGLAIFIARWLASRIFPRDTNLHSSLVIPVERRFEGRLYLLTLGITLALYTLLEEFSDTDRYSAETSAVLHFPLIVLASLVLLRLGWLLRRNKRDQDDNRVGERVYGDRLIAVLGKAIIAVGILSPFLAALGYAAAAQALTYPTILTVGLFGTIALLQRFIRDVYAVLRPGEGAAESLIPTLLGFALVLAALPLFALVWGVRVTELTELWARVRGGLSIGGVSISPGSFLTLVIVFVLGYLLTRGVQGALKTSVLPKTRIDPGGQVAIVSGIGYVGIFLAALLSITAAGIDLSSLAIVAGALSVGIGFDKTKKKKKSKKQK